MARPGQAVYTVTEENYYHLKPRPFLRNMLADVHTYIVDCTLEGKEEIKLTFVAQRLE